MRNTTISICKGMAIIAMVIGHSECPEWLMQAIYLWHMPLFFITAGYFFKLKYLDNAWDYVERRFKGLYIPFVKWSIFFWLIHNLLFKLNILNEAYGNAAGGVTHPFRTFQDSMQHLFNIVFTMGGYDTFFLAAFWFLRALLISSIAFLILYKLFSKVKFLKNENAIIIAIALCAYFLGMFKCILGLSITNVVQGGSREIWGVFFICIGYLYRKYQEKVPEGWGLSFLSVLVLAIAVLIGGASMQHQPKIHDIFVLPIPAVMGFFLIHHLSSIVDKGKGLFKRFLIFCGDNSINIVIFHVAAFKLVSLIKIAWYGLDFKQIGCHMVIHYRSDADWFWVLYSIVGVVVPLIGKYYVDKYKNRLNYGRISN